jgi:hypothetical protein
MASMLGVCSRSTGHHAGELAGNNRVAISAADSILRSFTDRPHAAWAFPADAAAEAEAAELTLRLLGVIAVEYGLDATRIRYGQKLYYAWIG